ALLVAARLGAEHGAAAGPIRRARGALAGASRSLLPPWLGAASSHFRASLGVVRARPCRRQLRHDDLMHDRYVGLDPEQLRGKVDGSGARAVAPPDVDRGR